MRGEKIYFTLGLVIGILLSVVFFYYFAPRYTTVKSGDTVLKQDTWTGRTWRLVDDDWKAIVGVPRDWDSIDKALLAALRIPFAEVNTDSALERLREKHPILKALPNDELLERIKLVYSRQVLVNMYLDSFVKT
ncbi:MAG: hypothetical protein MUC98_16380, partial [Desulfobacterota bacterium]|nr:hypothetical protein [Thermodesulfobacteriota bacterium]